MKTTALNDNVIDSLLSSPVVPQYVALLNTVGSDTSLTLTNNIFREMKTVRGTKRRSELLNTLDPKLVHLVGYVSGQHKHLYKSRDIELHTFKTHPNTVPYISESKHYDSCLNLGVRKLVNKSEQSVVHQHLNNFDRFMHKVMCDEEFGYHIGCCDYEGSYSSDLQEDYEAYKLGNMVYVVHGTKYHPIDNPDGFKGRARVHKYKLKTGELAWVVDKLYGDLCVYDVAKVLEDNGFTNLYYHRFIHTSTLRAKAIKGDDVSLVNTQVYHDRIYDLHRCPSTKTMRKNIGWLEVGSRTLYNKIPLNVFMYSYISSCVDNVTLTIPKTKFRGSLTDMLERLGYIRVTDNPWFNPLKYNQFTHYIHSGQDQYRIGNGVEIRLDHRLFNLTNPSGVNINITYEDVTPYYVDSQQHKVIRRFVPYLKNEIYRLSELPSF